VDRFAAGLPMVMSAPTYAMTRMVNPILYQCIERLQYSLRGTVALMKIGGTPDILLELEFVLLAYQRMRFPFQTNFLELYGISEDLFELLADASERSKTRALVIRVRNLLKGTASCSLSS
jgi:hypothetical protein